MSAYSGPCNITSANTVIDSKVIRCSITVGPGASGLVIKNSYIYGSVLQSSGSASFRVEDSFMDGGQCTDCGISKRNFTILRTEIIGTNRGSYCENACRIQDSWIHGTNLDLAGGAHASAVRAEQYLTLVHNVLACDYTGPFTNPETGCSADMTGYPDFAPIHHNTIDDNLFVANEFLGFCAYGGGTRSKPYSNDPSNATYIVFQNNVFQRGANGKCGTYGPMTDFQITNTGNQWTNNTWDDGRVVNADGSTGGVAPPRDTDRDGLSDGAELRRYHTDPRRRDTDRDNLDDGAEVRRYHTDPLKRDTDGDGLSDGAEVTRYKTSPRKPDTDGDGLSDGAEVRRYHTDPRKRDTDGDGRRDGAEVRAGTNPRVRG